LKVHHFAAACALVIGLSVTASAQGIDKPECIAPAKPGGGFDLTCRVAQEGLKPVLKQPLRVSFMPGGSGAVAINVFNSTRTDDPNTIVAFSTGTLLNIASGKFAPWTENDMRFVATVGADFGAVVVKADSKFKTIDDLIAALKEDITSVTFGSGGSVGSQDWMKGALLLESAGLDPKKIRYVAFDGGGEAIAALLGGNTDVFMADMGEMTPHMEAGTMRILASLSDERLPAPFAEVPTAKEQGYDVEWTIMRGFYMGKDVPDDAYNAWVETFEEAYKTEEFAKAQKDKGLIKLNISGEEFSNSMKERVARLREIAKRAGLIKE